VWIGVGRTCGGRLRKLGPKASIQTRRPREKINQHQLVTPLRAPSRSLPSPFRTAGRRVPASTRSLGEKRRELGVRMKNRCTSKQAYNFPSNSLPFLFILLSFPSNVIPQSIGLGFSTWHCKLDDAELGIAKVKPYDWET
jgi:hypothetical protein